MSRPWKKLTRGVKRLVKKVAPIASIALPIFLPGIGTALGAALGASGLGASVVGNALIGAGLGGISGGGRGAVLGAVGGGLGAGIGGTLGAAGSTAGRAGLQFAKKQALSSALQGGLQGYLGGGTLKSALKGAAIGGVTGGYGGSIANKIGLSGASANAFTGALRGAGGAYASGGKLKDALIGAAVGGAGGYLNYNDAPKTDPNSMVTTVVSGGKKIIVPTPRSLSRPNVSGIGSILGKVKGMGSNIGLNLNTMADIGSSLYNYKKSKDIEEELLKAQERYRQMLEPYQSAGREAQRRLSEALSSGLLGGDFNFEESPAYQYRLAEAEKALQRRQASAGNFFSGRALREASELSQGMASQEYDSAYQRDLQRQRNLYGMLSGQSAQGLNTAGALGSIYGNIGNIKGLADQYRSNLLTSTLSKLLRGYNNEDNDGYWRLRFG